MLNKLQRTGEAFYEIYLSAPVEVCESRDPKGLYEKARRGEVADFTGVSAPYEEPERADFVIDTGTLSIADSVKMLNEYVQKKFVLPSG